MRDSLTNSRLCVHCVLHILSGEMTVPTVTFACSQAVGLIDASSVRTALVCALKCCWLQHWLLQNL